MIDKLKLHNLVQEKQPNICQIVCSKNGNEIYNDEWNNFKKDDGCHVFSVTKSVVAILIGICVDKGLIKSIDDKVLDYFPSYKVKRGEKTIQNVTIKHLLTMKAPFKGSSNDPWVKVCISEDWTKTSLDFLGGKKGITNEFRYTTVCLHILTGIITSVSKMLTVDFANKYLFEPLGIPKHINYLVETKEEHVAFTLSKKPKENVWFCDPKGVGTAGYGLCFSATDLVKIGNLMLNKGTFNGKQIVSKTWIESIFTVTNKCNENFANMSYGLLWWIIDEENKIYGAIGDGGNVIYINESKNLVVGVTATFKPRVFDRVDFIRENLERFI